MRNAGSTNIALFLMLGLGGAGCAVLGESGAASAGTEESASGGNVTPELAAAPLPGGGEGEREGDSGGEGDSGTGAGAGAGGEGDAGTVTTSVDAGATGTGTGTEGLPPRPGTCSVQKDAAGFFTRQSALGSYVAFVPPGYDGSKPMPVLVGMHGCGDDALNYATWGVAPYDTRATQEYIGISLGSETGANHCWSMGGDDDKVLAAVEDIAKCFWVDPKKVVVSGFSSGGQLAYRVGLEHADRFAGIAIECSGLYAAGEADALLSQAPKKLPIAHRAHTGDTVFPLAKVKADWAKTTAAGFPLTTSEVAGGHDGTSADWTGFLLPQMASWLGM